MKFDRCEGTEDYEDLLNQTSGFSQDIVYKCIKGCSFTE